MLGRASPSLVRAPVRSRQRHRRWDLGYIQFVRDTSQDPLRHVQVYLGPGRHVVVDDEELLDDRWVEGMAWADQRRHQRCQRRCGAVYNRQLWMMPTFCTQKLYGTDKD